MIIQVSHKVKTYMYRKDIVSKFHLILKDWYQFGVGMLKNFNLKPIKWMAVNLSCLSMIFAPVAMGNEAEKLNKNNLSQMIVEFGLTKKTTLGEFWEKSKAYMPGHIYKDLEAFVKENKNLEMPEVSLTMSKSTEGSEIPVIRFMQNGKTHDIQFYGEENKWAKFNGVVLSASDISRVEDIFKRVEASDIKIKNEADKYRENKLQKQKVSLKLIKANEYKKDFARFSGFPRVTPQMWLGLTVEQRAGFIVKMHLLSLNARKVLSFSSDEATDSKKSSIKPKDSAGLQNIYNLLFTQSVQAESGKITPSAAVMVNGTSVRTKKGVVNIPYNAKSCVVAGYIGVYGKVSNINGKNRDGCSIDLAVATYKSNENLKFVQDANDLCAAEKQTSIACNPIIYGYPNGKVACIDRRSAEYQHATHFKSPANRETCDGKSRLASSDEIIQFNEKDYSNVQPREKQIAAIEADQKKDDYALTQSYIKGVLLKKDPIMLAMLEKGEWNLALDEELVRIQSQFEEAIEKAVKTCETDITGKHEKNQKLACDQLHRRWLFTERSIANLRDKACVKPALYIGNYGVGESSSAHTAKEKTALNKKTIDAKGTELCECPSVASGSTVDVTAKTKRVNFAQTCEMPVVAVEPPLVAAPKCEKPDGSCVDEATTAKCDKPLGIAGFDYEKCKCEDNKKLKQQAGDDGTYDCEGTNWLPWVLGGLGILALIAFFNKTKKPPQTTSASPTSPVCAAPKIGSPPNCTCPAAPAFCTLPQKIYNMNTCQCTSAPGPLICPNNSEAPLGNLAQCPKCADGSFKTTKACPSEGGSGNNTCINPPCSGGLPGTGQ